MEIQDLRTLSVAPEKLVAARGETPLSAAARELAFRRSIYIESRAAVSDAHPIFF
jgi:hypothetical protein